MFERTEWIDCICVSADAFIRLPHWVCHFNYVSQEYCGGFFTPIKYPHTEASLPGETVFSYTLLQLLLYTKPQDT